MSATPSASGHDKTPRRELLEEAADLVDGDRNHTYGSPTQNFANIAETWTTRFKHKLLPGETLTATDVADAMILLKICRNIAQTKRDNYTDLAGYAACGYETTLEPHDDSTSGTIVVSPEVTVYVNNSSIPSDEIGKLVRETLEQYRRSS